MPQVTITNAQGTETMTVEEFRRRRQLVECHKCWQWHPRGRCPFVPLTAARRRASLSQYSPRNDGIDSA